MLYVCVSRLCLAWTKRNRKQRLPHWYQLFGSKPPAFQRTLDGDVALIVRGLWGLVGLFQPHLLRMRRSVSDFGTSERGMLV